MDLLGVGVAAAVGEDAAVVGQPARPARDEVSAIDLG
jgi:hypothetical protein